MLRFPPVRLAAIAVLALLGASEALAWTLSLGGAGRRVYLHVGNGTRNADNPTVNTATADVDAAVLGTGQVVPMTTDSTQSQTLYSGDSFITCPDPSTQLLIGASYQRQNNNNGPASATLRVSSPTVLTNANGDTIPISEVRWVVSGPGNTPTQAPPQTIVGAGFFQGTSNQLLATIAANTYIENCHTFSFLNTTMRAAGIYQATVTYTVSSP